MEYLRNLILHCPNCRQEIIFIRDYKDVYCPKCWFHLSGKIKSEVIKLKQFRDDQNSEPDEKWINDLLEPERAKKRKYELKRTIRRKAQKELIDRGIDG